MARQRAAPPTPTPVRVSNPEAAAGVGVPAAADTPTEPATRKKRKPARAHTAEVRATSKQQKARKPRRKKTDDTPPQPPGRPPFVLTEEMAEQVRACAGFGLTNEQIAVVCGISASTFYEHKAQFSEHLEAGRAVAVARVREALYQQAAQGSLGHILAYHKIVLGWTETTRVESTGAEGGPMQLETRQILSPPEIMARLRTMFDRQRVTAAMDSGGAAGAALPALPSGE